MNPQNCFSPMKSLSCALLLLSLACAAGAISADPVQRSLVVAHTMPWFEAHPDARQWGWHWTMNAFDPNRMAEGKRSIAAHYYPLIGPYDSGDPAVIEYHLLLMKLAGLDGFIVDWYGLSDLLDYPVLHRNTAALFAAAGRLGLRMGICYEDQTIPRLVEAQRLPAGDRVKHAKREMQWLRANWFSQPAYLKLNGRPVVLSFGADGLTDAEWEQVFPPTGDRPLYLSEHRRRPAAGGSFDWPQPHLGLAGLDTFYQSTRGEPLLVPVAFPRFHDIYAEGKAEPGFPQIPDDGGRTFAVSLERALKSGAPLVQIATWNDWGEGTIIEPSREFGYRDLEVLQKARRAYDPAFAATPDDLRLPHRLWLLRGQQTGRPDLKPELDGIARLMAAGSGEELRSARERLDAIR